MMIAQYVPYAVAVVIVAAVFLDLRNGKIPNWLTLVPFALFIVVAATAPDKSVLAWQLGQAAVVFVVGLILFAVAGVGAGAVKLAAGIALFVPMSKGLATLGALVAAFFGAGLIIFILRKMIGSEDSSWYIMTKNIVSISLPIGIAGLAGLFLL